MRRNPYGCLTRVMPQMLSLYPGNSGASERTNALCARVAVTEFWNQSTADGPLSRSRRKSIHACEYWCTKSGSDQLT